MPPEDIPQIKPPSVLDPPQIKLAPEPVLSSNELHLGAVEADLPVLAKKRRFKLPNFKIKLKNKKVLLRVGLVLGVLLVLVAILVIVPVLSLVGSGRALATGADKLKASVDSKDITVVKSSLQDFQAKFQDFDSKYKRLSWAGALPFVGVYYKDGIAGLTAGKSALEAGWIVTETIEPYADIIGFGGPGGELGDSANDRIDFLIQTIGSILPRADELVVKARAANEELAKIDPNRYPEEFRGIEVRAKLAKYLELAQEATNFIANSKPLLESAPYLLGTDAPRTYLLIFQNDKELRPTGGFLTAYSIVQVSNGKIQPVSSNDIYNLDNKYTPTIEAPEVIRKYLEGPYLISDNLRLRDMNWSPDFKEAMEMFLPEAEKAGIADIDGVIAVDTQVVVNILNAIGTVDVPGYGQYSTNHDERCACPQVIYELESFADVEGPIVWSENEPGKIVFAPPNYLNRKEIVGPLMNSILSNALGQPKEKLPLLFEAGWKSLIEKHVLLYMYDAKAQEGAEAFGVAGQLSEFDADYVHIVDANLGGRKSNLYVTQEVHHEIEIDGEGNIVKTLDVTYQNPEKYDGWLNSVLPNWTRIYLPKGSEILDQVGFEDPGEVYEEFGKTVVSGGFELRPEGVKKVTIKYKLPFKAKDKYELMIQKQAGTDAPLHTITVGKKSEEFYLRSDRTLRIAL